MGAVKVAITMREDLVESLDRLVKAKAYPSRSRAVQVAVEEKLAKLNRVRLARECAKLDPKFEQTLADEGLAGERERWPEY